MLLYVLEPSVLRVVYFFRVTSFHNLLGYLEAVMQSIREAFYPVTLGLMWHVMEDRSNKLLGL